MLILVWTFLANTLRYMSTNMNSSTVEWHEVPSWKKHRCHLLHVKVSIFQSVEVNHWPFCMILKIDQGIIIIVKLITGNTWRQWGLIDILEISSLGHEEQMTVKAWDVHSMISVHGLRHPLLLSSCTVWFRDRDSQKYKGGYYVPPLHDEPGPGSSPILVQAFWWHVGYSLA